MDYEQIARWIHDFTKEQPTPHGNMLAIIARLLLDIDAKLDKTTNDTNPKG